MSLATMSQCHLRLCLTLRQVSVTGVQLCRVVQSVREGGKCMTRLVPQLRIADDGWWIIELHTAQQLQSYTMAQWVVRVVGECGW